MFETNVNDEFGIGKIEEHAYGNVTRNGYGEQREIHVISEVIYHFVRGCCIKNNLSEKFVLYPAKSYYLGQDRSATPTIFDQL